LSAKRNRVGQNQWVTDADVVDLVRVLARQMQDESIAAVLNRSGKSTGRGNSWTRGRVCSLRHEHKIAPYREGERADRGEVTIDEAGLIRLYSRRSVAQGDFCHEASARTLLNRTARHLPDLSTLIWVELPPLVIRAVRARTAKFGTSLDRMISSLVSS